MLSLWLMISALVTELCLLLIIVCGAVAGYRLQCWGFGMLIFGAVFKPVFTLILQKPSIQGGIEIYCKSINAQGSHEGLYFGMFLTQISYIVPPLLLLTGLIWMVWSIKSMQKRGNELSEQ